MAMTSEPEILTPQPGADRPKPFTPGHSGNPAGKPPGPNKMTRLLREAIITAAVVAGERMMHRDIDQLIEAHGLDNMPADAQAKLREIKDTGGLVRYLVWLAEVEPKAFSTLMGRVLPLQLAGEFKVEPTTPFAALMERINGTSRTLPK